MQEMEEELFDDFDEAPEFIDRAADRWLEKNSDKIIQTIVPTFGRSIEIVHEKQKVDSSELRQIAKYLAEEICRRMDDYGGYRIDKVEEAVAWKLLGGRPRSVCKYFEEHPEKHAEFADMLAKVEAVHNRLMGGRYVPTPQHVYTAVDTKPKASKKKAALALAGLAALAVAGIAGLYLKQQWSGQPSGGGQPSNSSQGGSQPSGTPSNATQPGGSTPSNATQPRNGGQPVEPSDTMPPSLTADYRFFLPDKLMVTASASDASGVSHVVAEVLGKNYTMVAVDGKYAVNVTDGKLYEIDQLPVRVFAFDKKGNAAVQHLVAVPSLQDKFLSYAVDKGYEEGSARQFYAEYEGLVKALYPNNASLLVPCVQLHAANSTVFGELYRNITGDKQVTVDKNALVAEAAKLFLELGYTGKVKVLESGSGQYKEQWLTRQTIQAFGNYSAAVAQGLPMHDRNDLLLLGNATQIDPAIADFKPNFPDEKLNLAFDNYYLATLVSKNYNDTLKYPVAARAYVKQVDQVVSPLINSSSMNDAFAYLDKLWKNHVQINEKGERFLPLDEKLIKVLFDDDNLAEIALRQSLLPVYTPVVKILHTNTTRRSTMVDKTTPPLEILFSNIDNFINYHNLVYKAFTYKANSTDDLKTFYMSVLGWYEVSADARAKGWSEILEHPDPIKVFIISWNRFVTDQLRYAPDTVANSSKYKQIMIENGTELPWSNIRIRGSESISPEENSPNQPIGIAPMRFEDGKRVTWEQVGMVVTAIGFLGAYTQGEEPRVEASGMIGWVVGYPMYRYDTYEYGNAHGDTGFHITPKVYELFKNVGKPVQLPLYITNGWVLDGESAAKEMRKTGIRSLPGRVYIESYYDKNQIFYYYY